MRKISLLVLLQIWKSSDPRNYQHVAKILGQTNVRGQEITCCLQGVRTPNREKRLLDDDAYVHFDGLLNFLMKRKQEGIHVYGERGTGWPQDREGLGQEDLQHHIALESLAMFC